MTNEFVPVARVFTLLIGDRPVLAFEASNFAEARELCRTSWMLGDLAELESDGQPLWDGSQKLTVRLADAGEIEVFRQADTQQQSDEIVLAYLIELDGA